MPQNIGANSIALGDGTIAASKDQVVIGSFNVADFSETKNPNDKGDYAFIVGNGTNEKQRSNAFAVDWNGNVTVNGNISTTISNTTINFLTEASLAPKKTTRGDLNYNSITDASKTISTINTLAYWNGKYNSNSSNLQYFNVDNTTKQFGTMAAEEASDYPKFNSNNNLNYPESYYVGRDFWANGQSSNTTGPGMRFAVDDKTVAALRYDTSTNSNLKNRLYLSQRTTSSAEAYERFYLPSPNENAGNYRLFSTRELIPVSNGGTNASTALQARKNLGILKTYCTTTGILSSDGKHGNTIVPKLWEKDYSTYTDEIRAIQLCARRPNEDSSPMMLWVIPTYSDTNISQNFTMSSGGYNVSVTVTKKSATQIEISSAGYASDYYLIITMN